MIDSVEPGLPDVPSIVCGYVDGAYPGYAELQATPLPVFGMATAYYEPPCEFRPYEGRETVWTEPYP